MSLATAWVRLLYLAAYVFWHLRLPRAVVYTCDLVLRVRPDDPVTRFNRAWYLLKIPGRRNDGIKGFQQLLPSHPSASGYYLLACALLEESRHEEAVEAFRETMRLEDSRSSDLFFNYAISLEALGRLEEAVEAYRSAALLAPSDHDAWWALGSLLVERGRRADAMPCLERAVRLSPSSSRALFLMWTLCELHRLDEAEHSAREMLALSPESFHATELLAVILGARERYDEALLTAREACRVSSDALSSRSVLALALAATGSLDEALLLARQVVESAPDDSDSHATLGAIYLERNDGAAALAAFERMAECLRSEANRPPLSSRRRLLEGRGNALSLLGRHDEAKAVFEEALRSDPEYFEKWPLPGYRPASGSSATEPTTPIP